MTRKEFIEMCGLLGIGIPLHTSLSSCGKNETNMTPGSKIIVIGAGPAGMTATYLLTQQGMGCSVT